MAALDAKYFTIFPITGNKPEQMTAGELWHYIKACSRKNYGWIASTAKIVELIREPDFPCNIRKKIERHFLKRFSSDWHNLPNYRGIEDDRALMSCYFDCIDDRLKEKFLYSLAEKRLERGLSTGLLAKAFWTEDRHKHFRKEWCKDVASDLYSRINESNFDLVAWSKSLIPKFKLDYVGMYELGYFNGDSSKIAEDAYRLTTQSEWQIAS